MSFLSKIKEFILNMSNSYVYYKENFLLLKRTNANYEKELFYLKSSLEFQIRTNEQLVKDNEDLIAFFNNNEEFKDEIESYKIETNEEIVNLIKFFDKKFTLTHEYIDQLTSKLIQEQTKQIKMDNELNHKLINDMNILSEKNSNMLDNFQDNLNLNLFNLSTNIQENMNSKLSNIQEDMNSKLSNIQNNFDSNLSSLTDVQKNTNSNLEDVLNNIQDNTNTSLQELYSNMTKNNDNLHTKLIEDYNNANSEIMKYLESNLDLEKVEILNKISDDLNKNNLDVFYSFNKINKMALFDEDFYRNEYNYDSDINPLLHYLYKGYAQNKNPSKKFNTGYYKNNMNSDTFSNPLVYFVNKGLKEGNIKINEKVHKHIHVDKLDLDKKIVKMKNKGTIDSNRKEKIIISLTSFPERMYDIHYCLYSLLNQSFKPDRIILWLTEEEFPRKELDLPVEVLYLKNFGLEIKFCEENFKPYNKMVFSLKEFSNHIIVTADDDVYYPKNWLKTLYEYHKRNPDSIISHRSRRIVYDSVNGFGNYDSWELITQETDASYLNFVLGVGGALYPPKSLYKDVVDDEIFMELSPTNDDYWFWAMAILNHTKIVVPEDNYYELVYINPARQVRLINERTLYSQNYPSKNDISFKNIIGKYPEIVRIIYEESIG